MRSRACYGTWNCGIMELWNYGTMELWNYGTMELWNYGIMELWNYGTHVLDVLLLVLASFIHEKYS